MDPTVRSGSPTLDAATGPLCLRDARVDFLQQCARRIHCGGRGLRSGQAETEQELLVFLIELENLQNPRARVFQQIARLRLANAPSGHGAQCGQRLIQFTEQIAFSFYKLR